MDNITYNKDAIYDISIVNKDTGRMEFQERTDCLIVLCNDTVKDGIHAIKMFNCNGYTVANIIHGLNEMQKIIAKNYPVEYRAAKLKQFLED